MKLTKDTIARLPILNEEELGGFYADTEKVRLTERQLREIIAKSIKRVLNEMAAYHGGAKLFNAFDLSKAHTGEGGTMYGYGVYVTTNPNTAKYYMNIASQGQKVGYMYEVQIPDDNGGNYLNIQKNPPQVYDYLMRGLSKV